MRVFLIPLLAALSLSSCAFNAKLDYMPPYPAEALYEAEKHVKQVVYLNWSELPGKCRTRSSIAGCYDVDQTMYLLEGMTHKANYNTYLHELGHAYDVFVLGKSWEDTAKHKDWCEGHIDWEFCVWAKGN